MKQKILGNGVARYILAGGLSYAIELACLLGLYKLGGFPVEAATAIAFWIGLATSFVLQKVFAFQDYEKAVRIISRQLTAYGVLVGINYLFTLGVVALFPDKWVVVSRTLALITTTAWNYVAYQYIFGTKKTDHKALKATARQCLMLKNPYFNALLLTLPIVAFSFKMLLSGNKIVPGDPDYYFQQYEAFRRSVLDFHQWPGWNSWIGGGIPLFANIQFGLVSIQTPFILAFGTIVGFKLAIVVYQIICFFGFKKLFQAHFGAEPFRAICLAYITVFGSFLTFRIIAGHFTFLMIAFVPWLLLFYFQREKKRYWLWFALVASLMIWSAPHYTTIMALVVVGVWFLIETIFRIIGSWRKHNWGPLAATLKQDGLFFAKAGGLVVVLTTYRMYFVAKFIKDFPRFEDAANEPFTGIVTGLRAIWQPNQFYGSTPILPTGWNWGEATTYIGIGTFVCLCLVMLAYAKRLRSKQSSPFSYPVGVLLVLFAAFFILGMANFAPIAPYTLLNNLPVFDSMRVATRWLMWASLMVLFILAAYRAKRFRIIINVILALTVAELFAFHSIVLARAFTMRTEQYRPAHARFDQQEHFRIPRPTYGPGDAQTFFYDENLYETTRNNYGQVIAGDSLVDTRQPNTTIRCGANQGGCPFINGNARVAYWSPNKLILKRTHRGPIILNMNPGKGWKVNGTYVFADYKVTDPKRPFVVTDPARTITLEYAPRFSPNWVGNKLWR